MAKIPNLLAIALLNSLFLGRVIKIFKKKLRIKIFKIQAQMLLLAS